MAGVSTATGIAGNLSSNILSGLWNKAAQVFKDIISAPQAVAEMKGQTERLENVINGIKEKLAQEQKPPQRIVEAWLDKAEKAIESSKSIGNEYQQRRNCVSCCPNCFSRYEISKRVGDWKVEVACKIVLSTRSTAVCEGMRVDKTISVKPLSDDEAWELFCSGAFRHGNVPQEMEDIARKVAGECKGLPLAINVIAAAMRNHSYRHEWEHALQQMQNVETFYGTHDEIEKKLFQRLKLSYNVLPDYMKICFLYFAAYPEDEEIEVEEIIDLWVAEGLVKGSGENYLPDTAHSFLNHLSDRCLIEVVRKDDVMGRIETVKIHDVLRDLAIRVAENEHRCYFKEAGRGVSNFPSAEVVGEGCEKLSLMRNNLQSLPTTFACSSLSVLLLSNNYNITEVPGSFLNELPSLRVLDLSSTGIESLPPCIGNLKHLASLQLKGTDICELPESIGDLKELQFLNLNGCGQLRCLPDRISDLKRLRALDIRACSRLEHLPRGISQLVSLERLDIYLCKIALEFEEEEANAERKNACLKDLQTLSRLRVCRVKIKSAVKEGVFGNWSKMRNLYLDCKNANSQDYLPQDMQAMKDLEGLSLAACDVERLPSWVTQSRKLAFLCLNGCKELKDLRADLPCLRQLSIVRCHKLEELELGMGAVGAASASGGLGEGAPPLSPMLKSVWVLRCPKLKRLRGGWDKLNHLEGIKGSREWWDAIQWEDPNMKTLLQNKFEEKW